MKRRNHNGLGPRSTRFYTRSTYAYRDPFGSKRGETHPSVLPLAFLLASALHTRDVL